MNRQEDVYDYTPGTEAGWDISQPDKGLCRCSIFRHRVLHVHQQEEVVQAAIHEGSTILLKHLICTMMSKSDVMLWRIQRM